MERRFGDAASIQYLDTSRQDVRDAHAEMIGRIQGESLIYPVTVIEGQPVYDGAVSYPAILRAIETRLAEHQRA